MKRFTGLSFVTILILALLGVPRVIGHDLGWLEEENFVNAVFVFLPMIIWISVAAAKEGVRPFKSMLVPGIIYGIMLAAVHQVLWRTSFPVSPELGGNFTQVPEYIRTGVPRIAAVFSGMMTGTIMGVILGILALVILKFLAAHPHQVFSREHLFDRIWGVEAYGDISTVTVHIRKIREKIENEDRKFIETVWGVGYKFLN